MTAKKQSGATLQRIGTGENATFNGRMADLRVYDRALSPTEIRTLSR